MAAQDDVNRVFREFKRYTGDGLPGEPVSAPLPVGDPQSGVNNPKKSEIRAVLIAVLLASGLSIEQAEAAADRAEAAADAAEAALSSISTTSFATKAAAQAYSPAVAPTYLRLEGYTAAGDGGGALYKKAASEPTHAGKFSITAGGATAWYEIASVHLDPRMFGAKGDGTTNDTAALNAVMVAAKALGKSVHFPQGTFLTTTGLPIHTGAIIKGEGISRTVIKLANGANTSVLYGERVSTLFGTAPADGDDLFLLEGFTVDGNRANNLTAGHGLYIYGRRFTIRDVAFINTRDSGLVTKHSDTGASYGMESFLLNVVIDNVGKHGWDFQGPHDTSVISMRVIDASQNTDNTFNGISCGALAFARWFDLHVWHRAAATNRCNFAFYSLGGNELISSHLEGCRQILRHGGTLDTVQGCLLYAPFGQSAGYAMIYFAGNDNIHVGNRYVNSQDNAYNDCFAIQFGAGSNVGGNFVVEGRFLDFKKRTPFNFVNTAGLNRITGRGSCTSGGMAVFGGNPNANDEIDYEQSGTYINYRKPILYDAYAGDGAAATGGVPVGGVYRNSTTNALTIRVS